MRVQIGTAAEPSIAAYSGRRVGEIARALGRPPADVFFEVLQKDGLATSWGVVTDIGGRVTASVFAFNNAVAGLGLIVAPLLFGYLTDQFGWTAVFISVAVTYVLCALSWLAIDCTIPMMEERA